MSSPPQPPRHLRWLRDELAHLIERGVIDRTTSVRLRAHYGLDRLGAERNWAVLVFAVLGATMIGAGVVLILAHNWDELSRPARAGVSLGVLVLAQAFAGWVLARRADSPAWREAAGIGLTAATGAAIALVSQTYHVEGELADFMQAWLWLALPVAYLLESRVVAAFCFAAAPVLGLERHEAPLGYVAFALAGLPYVALLLRSHRDRGLTHFVVLVAAVAVPLGCGQSVFDDHLAPWPVFYGGWLGMLAALGLRLERHEIAPSFAAPMTSVALAGAVALSLALTFEDAWDPAGGRPMQDSIAAYGFLAAALALGVFALTALPAALRDRRFAMLALLALPVFAGLGHLLVLARAPDMVGLVLFNMYLFGLGLATLGAGIVHGSLRRTNAGLVILSLLFAVRFFDVELSFVARGLGFMLVGAAFVGVNVWLARRRSAGEGPAR